MYMPLGKRSHYHKFPYTPSLRVSFPVRRVGKLSGSTFLKRLLPSNESHTWQSANSRDKLAPASQLPFSSTSPSLAHTERTCARTDYRKMTQGAANNFAQFMVVGPTCFFLGILFAQLPYDYNVLWTTPTDHATYFNMLESHIKFLYASPPIVSRILNLVIGTGLLGFLIKLFKPNQANMLFDGASLVLYMAGITVYLTNIVKGFRVVTAGIYGDLEKAAPGEVTEEDMGDYISRDDTLRVFAASNTILSLVLVGVLVLQAGQWYAKRAEEKEIQEFERLAEEKKGVGKKKQ
ncbi:hypothetical protein P3342_010675 [Pyrenophora teres f. teres]|nr:hypothetical protein P3342_010675 [Pyrenophora teres f. teres]